MPLIPRVKELLSDVARITCENSGQAGLTVGVFLMTVLYAGAAYTQGDPTIVGAVPMDVVSSSASIEPWVLISAIAFNSLGLFAAALKSWASARDKRTEDLEKQLDGSQKALIIETRARAAAEGRLEALREDRHAE